MAAVDNSSPDTTGLLPCPFCAGSAELLNGGPGNWFVRCDNCFVATNDVQRDHAIELWNNRAPHSSADITSPGFKDIERLITEFFSAIGANVEFEDAEWHAQFDDPVSLTSLAIEVAKLIPAPAQPSWQPIETAPHATKVILGWFYNDKWECETGYASQGWSRNGISTMSRHGQATHWQPLPSPLSSTEGKSHEQCDQCPEPMDGPHHPECYRFIEPATERWEVGKNGWDASDEMTREDI